MSLMSASRKYLNTQARKHEAAYPDNQQFSIKPNGDLWLARLKAKDPVPGVDELTELIKSRMPQRNILDIIVDTQKTLNWCKPFGPISGFESKTR